jgi:hypothetical protein
MLRFSCEAEGDAPGHRPKETEMARQTTSQNLSELAAQLLTGAAKATGEQREMMLAMAKRYDEEAAALRVQEAAKERADREFWASQDVLTNWVS